jgi:hypothetical protein
MTRLERAAPLLLFAFCFALYLAGAARLSVMPMFERDNVFFRSDTHRVFEELTGDRAADLRRTSAHPAFVLFHNPLGRGLTIVFETLGAEKQAARQWASSLLTALAGALAAVLALRLLGVLGVSLLRAVLFSALLGASAAHWVFASAPETWIFSALGLTATALAAARPGLPEWRFQLAAVYAFSIVTSNLVPIGVFALLRHAQVAGLPAARVAARAAASVALAVGIVAGLSLVQKAIYPTTDYFFAPRSVTKEAKWIKWGRWTETPVETAKILVRHLALDNVVAPAPRNDPHDGLPMASIEHAGRPEYRSRLPVLAVWIAILALAARGAFQRGLYTLPLLAALAYLGFNLAFHSLFGNDRMLYSCDWTVFTIAVVAAAFERGAPPGGRLGTAATALLLLFLAFALASNWHFLAEVAEVGTGLN